MPRTAESHRLRVQTLTDTSLAASFLCLAADLDFYSPPYREALLLEAARRVTPEYAATHYSPALMEGLRAEARRKGEIR